MMVYASGSCMKLRRGRLASVAGSGLCPRPTDAWLSPRASRIHLARLDPLGLRALRTAASRDCDMFAPENCAGCKQKKMDVILRMRVTICFVTGSLMALSRFVVLSVRRVN